MYQKKRESDIRCPLEYGFGLLEGKWKTRILCELHYLGTLRFSELKNDLEGITDGVLASTLNDLIAADLIEKESIGHQNAYITLYTISPKGESLIPLLKDLCLWSESYYKESSLLSLKPCVTCNSKVERKTV